MRHRNLALADRDNASRSLDSSLRLEELSDRELLDALSEASRNEDLHSLRLLADEAGRRDTE